MAEIKPARFSSLWGQLFPVWSAKRAIRTLLEFSIVTGDRQRGFAPLINRLSDAAIVLGTSSITFARSYGRLIRVSAFLPFCALSRNESSQKRNERAHLIAPIVAGLRGPCKIPFETRMFLRNRDCGSRRVFVVENLVALPQLY